MKPITSRDNPQYKDLKRLATSSQTRRKTAQTLLDGVHLCEAWLDHAGSPHLCVVSETANVLPEVAAIVSRCLATQVRAILLPDALYQPLSQVENGIGILFVIDIPTPLVPERLTQPAILLDRVQDPGNLGSILRSAAAAGIAEVYCSAGCAQAWSPRVLRAGMGAHFQLQIVENDDLTARIAAGSVPVLATSSHTDQTLFDTNLRRDVAWLFGHEGQGVSDSLLDLATETVTIPHIGVMESLNVAASAAICLFEQLRQRRGA